MTQTEKPKALPHEGTVTAISHKDGVPFGLKLDDGDWKNYTKAEWREGTWYEPQKGDRVRIMVSEGKWIRSIERLNGVQSHYEIGQVPVAGRDLSITRSVAIKAATDVIVALIGQGRYADEPDFGATKQIAVDLPALAQDLERFMLRDEVGFE